MSLKPAAAQIKVLDIGATREEIREALEAARENVETPLDNFFEELFGGACTGTALHAAINGYLVWKGAKLKEEAMEDTVYSSIVTTGGLGASFAVEALLGRAFLVAEIESAAALLASPIGAVLITAVSLYARGYLKRLANRRGTARRIAQGNANVARLMAHFDTQGSYA